MVNTCPDKAFRKDFNPTVLGPLRKDECKF